MEFFNCFTELDILYYVTADFCAFLTSKYVLTPSLLDSFYNLITWTYMTIWHARVIFFSLQIRTKIENINT